RSTCRTRHPASTSVDSHRARPPPPSFPTRRSSDLQHGDQEGLPLAGRGIDHLAVLEDQAHILHFAAVMHRREAETDRSLDAVLQDRKSTRLNSSHVKISYAVFCLKKKKKSVTGREE